MRVNNLARKTMGILMAMLLTSALALNAFAAEESNVSLDEQEDSIIAVEQARKWFVQNHSKFYDMRNVKAELVKTFENSTEIRYTVALSCETKLKVDDMRELPFVKGLYAERDCITAQAATAAAKEKATATAAAIDVYMSEVTDSAKIGEYSDLTMDIVLVKDKEDLDAPLKMYYQDGMETTLYDIEIMNLDEDEMYEEGRATAHELAATATAKANDAVTLGYSGYDREAARDYALRWSSSPTNCYDDGSSCGILQARYTWNNSVYPYNSIFKHNDCADFVSQAMAAGGLPQGGSWFRTKNVTTASWGAAWTSVSSLKSYMTDSSHKYWDTSTFAKCNAGNILLTSSSHVVMITLNDTVTHRYTGHTNDRHHYEFDHVNGYQYYTIKTT